MLKIAWKYGIPFGVFLISSANAASPYLASANRGAQWLAIQQNVDGSWGSRPDIKPYHTVEAVRALAADYSRGDAYYAGLTWLANHAADNVDAVARRIVGLTGHGDSLASSSSYLQGSQDRDRLGFNGWGLTPFYLSSAIDTALSLEAYAEIGSTFQVQPALNYLKNTQRNGTNDRGWSVGSTDATDLAVTSLVIQALVRFKTLDATITTRVADAVNTLNVMVSATATPGMQALAAQAAIDAGNSTVAATFLGRLTSTQNLDGSWSGDLYATALATRALATAAQAGTLATSVTIPDQALRKAINQALGRNAMDNLNRGELAQLTGLSAVDVGISDLTGLEWATNLTSADLRNNDITSTAPLSGLTQLTTVLLTGNPVTGSNAVAVPFLPPLGWGVMAVILLAITRRVSRLSSTC